MHSPGRLIHRERNEVGALAERSLLMEAGACIGQDFWMMKIGTRTMRSRSATKVVQPGTGAKAGAKWLVRSHRPQPVLVLPSLCSDHSFRSLILHASATLSLSRSLDERYERAQIFLLA